MATGMYPMGTGHPYPHSLDQNIFHRITRESRRVRNSFRTRKYTRIQQKYNNFQQVKYHNF